MSEKRVEYPYEESNVSWVNSGLYELANPRLMVNEEQKGLHPMKNVCSSKIMPSKESEVVIPSSKIHDFLKSEYFSTAYYQYPTEREMSRPNFMSPRRPERNIGNVPCLLNDYPKKMHQMPFSKALPGGLMENKSHPFEKCFLVSLYIETKDLHMGPFPFEIHPKTNVRLLKLQVGKELGIPTSFQSWILNRINLDFDTPLVEYGLTPMSTLFLYVDSSYKMPLTEKRIMEMLQMKYSFKKSGPVAQNANTFYVHKTEGSVSKSADLHGLTGDAIPQTSQQILSVPPKGNISISKEGNDLQELSTVFIPGSLTKAHKVDKRSGERKNSNSSYQEIKAINKSKISKRKSLPCLSNNDESSWKKQENSTNVKKEILLSEKNTRKTSNISIAGIDKFESSNSCAESLEQEITKQVISLQRKNSKPSILRQIKDVHKDKIRKMSDSSVDELLHKSVDVFPNQQYSSSSSAKSHELKLSVKFKEGSQSISDLSHAKELETNHSDPPQSTSAAHIPEEFISHDGMLASGIPHEKLGIACSEESQSAKAIENFVEDVASNESLYSENTAKHQDTPPTVDSTPDMNGPNSSNIEPVDVGEPHLEVYIECSESSNIIDTNLENSEISKEQKGILNQALAENYDFLLRMENMNLVKNVLHFTCPICFGEFESDEGVVLHECLHTFCVDCLAKAIDYAQEVLVKCPYRDDDYSCQSFLQQREIKALVTAEVYERYLQRSIVTAESMAEKSFHCKMPDCPGWCMFEANINVFHCPVCSHYNCLNCQAIHEGLNCRQYQDKLKREVKLDKDSEKTLELLNKMIEDGKAMKCPKCDLIVMKKWGCDWLKCCICKTEICWITKGPRWGPKGQGDTSGGCKCGVNGKKCHPSCTYCH